MVPQVISRVAPWVISNMVSRMVSHQVVESPKAQPAKPLTIRMLCSFVDGSVGDFANGFVGESVGGFAGGFVPGG